MLLSSGSIKHSCLSKMLTDCSSLALSGCALETYVLAAGPPPLTENLTISDYY